MSSAERRAEYLSLARAAAFQLGTQRDFVTVDCVRQVCPPWDDLDPRIMGRVFLERDWVVLRLVNSTRKLCHGRPIRRFRLRRRPKVAKRFH